MQEIIALFTVFGIHLSTTTLRQLSQVVFALLAMTGRVTMLNISRWTLQGGSYRTIQRFFNTVLPWTTLLWVFFHTHLSDPEGVYIIADDETIKSNIEDTIIASQTLTYKQDVLYTYIPFLIESLQNEDEAVAKQALKFLTNVVRQIDTTTENIPFEKFPSVWNENTYQHWKKWWNTTGEKDYQRSTQKESH